MSEERTVDRASEWYWNESPVAVSSQGDASDQAVLELRRLLSDDRIDDARRVFVSIDTSTRNDGRLRAISSWLDLLQASSPAERSHALQGLVDEADQRDRGPFVESMAIVALLSAGKKEEARRRLERAKETMAASQPDLLYAEAVLASAEGRQPAAMTALHQLKSSYPRRSVPLLTREMTVAGALGQEDVFRAAYVERQRRSGGRMISAVPWLWSHRLLRYVAALGSWFVGVVSGLLALQLVGIVGCYLNILLIHHVTRNGKATRMLAILGLLLILLTVAYSLGWL